METSRNKLRLHRKRRSRSKISGDSKRPRLAVFRSLSGIYAQAVDDGVGKTLVSASLKEAKAKNNLEGARSVGKLLAKKCLKEGIKQAVFDRSGYRYHGKVKSLAEGAREEGLRF